MTLEYSCLNWLTWRNKRKNYRLILFICCVILEQEKTGCSIGNEIWVLNFTTFKERNMDTFEGNIVLWLKSWCYDFSGVGAPVLFSTLIPQSMIQAQRNVESNSKAFIALWITALLLTINLTDFLTGMVLPVYPKVNYPSVKLCEVYFGLSVFTHIAKILYAYTLIFWGHVTIITLMKRNTLKSNMCWLI